MPHSFSYELSITRVGNTWFNSKLTVAVKDHIGVVIFSEETGCLDTSTIGKAIDMHRDIAYRQLVLKDHSSNPDTLVVNSVHIDYKDSVFMNDYVGDKFI